MTTSKPWRMPCARRRTNRSGYRPIGGVHETLEEPVSTDLIQIRDATGGGFRYRDLLEKRIVTRAGRCVGDWNLLEDGDRVMVCCSGGKDSYALLDVLVLLRRRAPNRFDLVAVNVDQGYDGYEQKVVEAHLRTREVHGVEVRMVSSD